MDKKTKQTIVAIIISILSIIASALGCAYGVPAEKIDGAEFNVVCIAE